MLFVFNQCNMFVPVSEALLCLHTGLVQSRCQKTAEVALYFTYLLDTVSWKEIYNSILLTIASK